MQSSGLRVNSVPKDGGNQFSGTFFVYGAGQRLQSDNRTDAMKASPRPAAHHASPGTAYDYQINPSFGGPLAKDKLWFYVTYKYRERQDLRRQLAFRRRQPGIPAVDGQLQRRRPLSPGRPPTKDKIRVYVEKQFNGEFYNGFNTLATSTPEASTDAWGRGWIPQVRWTRAPPASCCSKRASPTTTSRTSRTAGRPSGPAICRA